MAPALLIAEMVGIAVLAAVITSSPCFIPNDFKEISKASVPLPTATPNFDLYFLTKFFSNLLISFPKKICPLFKDFLILRYISFFYLSNSRL